MLDSEWYVARLVCSVRFVVTILRNSILILVCVFFSFRKRLTLEARDVENDGMDADEDVETDGTAVAEDVEAAEDEDLARDPEAPRSHRASMSRAWMPSHPFKLYRVAKATSESFPHGREDLVKEKQQKKNNNKPINQSTKQCSLSVVVS